MIWKPGLTFDDVKRITIFEALKFYKGNKSRTARALGLSLRTVREWINRKYRK